MKSRTALIGGNHGLKVVFNCANADVAFVNPRSSAFIQVFCGTSILNGEEKAFFTSATLGSLLSKIITYGTLSCKLPSSVRSFTRTSRSQLSNIACACALTSEDTLSASTMACSAFADTIPIPL